MVERHKGIERVVGCLSHRWKTVSDKEEEKSFLLLMKTRISRAKGKEGVHMAVGYVQKTHLLFGLLQSISPSLSFCLSICLPTHRRNKHFKQTTTPTKARTQTLIVCKFWSEEYSVHAGEQRVCLIPFYHKVAFALDTCGKYDISFHIVK